MSQASDITTANFTKQVRVYYEDTDAGGVVYHSQYLNFMERCRSDWLVEHDLDVSTLAKEHDLVFVVGEAAIKYHAPARLADNLLVTCSVLQVGKVSVKLRQTIYNRDKLLCSATIKLATLDPTSFTLTTMPKDLLPVFKEIGS